MRGSLGAPFWHSQSPRPEDTVVSVCSSSGGKTKTLSSFVTGLLCGLDKALTLSGSQTFYYKKEPGKVM